VEAEGGHSDALIGNQQEDPWTFVCVTQKSVCCGVYVFSSGKTDNENNTFV
jgi:hypothetical protein